MKPLILLIVRRARFNFVLRSAWHVEANYIYRYLPDTKGNPNEIIVLHSQHNCYDKALEAAGAKLKVIGDADESAVV